MTKMCYYGWYLHFNDSLLVINHETILLFQVQVV
jgi:hypothetical protein